MKFSSYQIDDDDVFPYLYIRKYVREGGGEGGREQKKRREQKEGVKAQHCEESLVLLRAIHDRPVVQRNEGGEKWE